MQIKRILALFVFMLSLSAATNAQENTDSKSGFLPEAKWSALFHKQVNDNIYAKYYSWQADLGLDLAIYQNDKLGINMNIVFETIGAEKMGARITVADTTYLLGFDVDYEFSSNTKIKSGLEHLSSHPTTDLVILLVREVEKGRKLPSFDRKIFSDMNVIFVELQKEYNFLPLEPGFRIRLQPFNLDFGKGFFYHTQPVYLKTQFNLWQGAESRLITESQHEFGKNRFNDFKLQIELLARKRKEGQVQLFIAGSPGDGVHVSPNLGIFRNGIRAGFRLVFHSN